MSPGPVGAANFAVPLPVASASRGLIFTWPQAVAPVGGLAGFAEREGQDPCLDAYTVSEVDLAEGPRLSATLLES